MPLPRRTGRVSDHIMDLAYRVVLLLQLADYSNMSLPPELKLYAFIHVISRSSYVRAAPTGPSIFPLLFNFYSAQVFFNTTFLVVY